jgi:very-short-patch-repair endonuclease
MDRERILQARALRKAMTGVELMVWDQLRKRQIAGFKFRRQAPIGRYVVDFVCLSERLIVEVDGPSHDFTVDADRRRALWIQSQGYRLINFTADEVLQDPETVGLTVAAALSGVDVSELMG